ncbi:hypothetical protein KSP40_PGU013573 [Platanthera guangdongensis]|uniref:LAGLIDADG homing endonuclease n=1 Tax=Platanthera guangdongensis TaxID=2320717 RepID=A0ABR2MGT0_9ASPA
MLAGICGDWMLGSSKEEAALSGMPLGLDFIEPVFELENSASPLDVIRCYYKIPNPCRLALLTGKLTAGKQRESRRKKNPAFQSLSVSLLHAGIVKNPQHSSSSRASQPASSMRESPLTKLIEAIVAQILICEGQDGNNNVFWSGGTGHRRKKCEVLERNGTQVGSISREEPKTSSINVHPVFFRQWRQQLYLHRQRGRDI